MIIIGPSVAYSQTAITGTVKDEAGEPVPYATVYLHETFEGGASDINGDFHIKTQHTGAATLVVSAVGYETTRQAIEIENETSAYQLTLKTASQVLGAVVISAGTFDASDKAKSAMLKPMDIVRNAGAQGDIFRALQTLPGVSPAGNETGIFVRGGDAHETKTVIDGAIVEKPFFSETPNIASRSRFDPFMFKGTLFTTGGYSAEYGRALSSVLLLETQDIPEYTSSSVGVNMAGIHASHQQVWGERETALIADLSYNNLNLLFGSVPQNVDWVKPPEGIGTNWAFRHKTKNGMFKSLLQHQRGRIGIRTHNFEDADDPHLFSNRNNTTYWNTNYQGMIGKKWGLYAGVALNQNTDDLAFDANTIEDKYRIIHGKTTLYYDITAGASIKMGVESFAEKNAIATNYYAGEIHDQYTALYTESDISLGERWALRAGLRAEHSSFLGKINLAPRTSMAYKTGKDSQVSLAYGHFYQKPESEFLFYTASLNYEKATHLIANYQWITDTRSLRVELYDKRYTQLVKGEPEVALTNQGNGHSRGVDVFWKDKESIGNLDYWVSYSYVDAERNYKDYPMAATPPFVTDHTLNIVANCPLDYPMLTPGITYTFATGRRYFNPNNELYLDDRTRAYHNVSINLSYVTQLLGNFAVLYGSLNNPIGVEQIFGYQYSEDGSQRVAIRPSADRTFFLGLFVNF